MTSKYSKIYTSNVVQHNIYGIPKIHRANISLQPIVFFMNLAIFGLVKFIAGILQKLRKIGILKINFNSKIMLISKR